jgi:UTP--glucose-1-phosphate uridylyltransferase
MKVTKVVVPVAGWGTGLLPATKNVPKEMLPIGNKPIIQYVVEEAQAAGLSDVIFVTNQNKVIIQDHFDYNLGLERVLERAGKLDLLKTVRDVAEMVTVIAIRQKEQLGLGHAVLRARDICSDGPFAVMVGDDLMFGGDPAIGQLVEAAQAEHMPVVGVIEVPGSQVDKYGIIQGEEISPGMYRVRGVVEKPAVGTAPSRLAMVGRYVLFPDIFEHLEGCTPGVGGEIQLTDALQALVKKNRLLAVKLKGRRFDAGDWPEYLAANVYFGLQDPAVKDVIRKRLTEVLEG